MSQRFAAVEQRYPGNSVGQVGDRRVRVRIELRQHLPKGGQSLTDQGQIGARFEIGLRGIGHVGARGNDPGTGAPRGPDHVAGSVAHGAQAHLA